MKNRAVKRILALAAFLLLAASPLALAKGPQGIKWTPHNLSTSGADIFYKTNEDEICIFCHTPHGGTLSGPLWNRNLPVASSFTHYTSSTLTAAASNATRAVSTESLLCLSCHDGTVATNRVINPSNDIGQPDNAMQGPGQPVYIEDMFGIPASRIGSAPGVFGGTGNLTDDHPISFSYYDAEADVNETGLHAPGDVLAMTEGPRFFGAGMVAGGLRVECATCHDPHVDYGNELSGSPNYTDVNYTKYAPFLVMSNTGSALCLACHNK